MQGEAALEPTWETIQGPADEVVVCSSVSEPTVLVCGSTASEALVASAHAALWIVLRLGDPTCASQVRAHFAKLFVKSVRLHASSPDAPRTLPCCGPSFLRQDTSAEPALRWRVPVSCVTTVHPRAQPPERPAGAEPPAAQSRCHVAPCHLCTRLPCTVLTQHAHHIEVQPADSGSGARLSGSASAAASASAAVTLLSWSHLLSGR